MSQLYDGQASKHTYFPRDTDFSGANDVRDLLAKIKEFVYRNRIRLGEFF